MATSSGGWSSKETTVSWRALKKAEEKQPWASHLRAAHCSLLTRLETVVPV